MSTATASVKSEKKQDKVNVLVIELTNQQQSGYKLVGSEEGDESDMLPTYLSAPNARKIRNSCKMVEVVDGLRKHVEIRYIHNCEEILVSEQVRLNRTPNKAQDVIWLNNGKLMVFESGSTIGLYRFLKNHENNKSNPNRPEGAVDVFEEINTNVDTKSAILAYEQEKRVLDYVHSLRVGDEFNEDALQYLSDLFKLNYDDETSSEEAWVNIAEFGRQNPELFMAKVAASASLTEADVNRALGFGLIDLGETVATFSETGKTIVDYPSGLVNAEKTKYVIQYFLNPKNSTANQVLRSELNHKSIGMAGPVR